MFDTDERRGTAIVVVGLLVVLGAFAANEVGERLVGADAEIAARGLEEAVDQFDSMADLQMAMVSGGHHLPTGASLGFVDDLHAVALEEVRALIATRCVRVEVSAPDVDSELLVDEAQVSRGPCA